MPKASTYRTADDLHVTDDRGTPVLCGLLVAYRDGAGFSPAAFARSARERAHKVTLVRQRDERVRIPVGRLLDLEDRPEGLWAQFALAEALTDEEARKVTVAYRPIRTDEQGNVTEAVLSHVVAGTDPHRDRQARQSRLSSILRASAPDLAPSRSAPCPR